MAFSSTITITGSTNITNFNIYQCPTSDCTGCVAITGSTGENVSRIKLLTGHTVTVSEGYNYIKLVADTLTCNNSICMEVIGIPTPTPTNTVTIGLTPTPTSTVTPTNTITPTNTVTPTPTNTVTPTPEPTSEFQLPTPTPTNTIGPTPTPTPTNTIGLTPTPTSTIGGTNAVEALNGVPLFAHVWPMMGNRLFEDQNTEITEQGTYQDDIYAIEDLAEVNSIGDEAFKRLPWYAVSGSSQQYPVSIWEYNNGNSRWEDTGNNDTGKTINWSLQLNEAIMEQYIEYAVRAGLQGFMLVSYANDAYISLFRQLFRNASNKKGLKICYSLNFGGGGDGPGEYDDDILDDNIHTPYKDTVYDFALDIVQPWYATAKKIINGNPVQVPIVHHITGFEGTDQNPGKTQAWLDLERIKARVIVNRTTPLGETFNILMTTFHEVSAGSADATGNTWNATSSYYLQPELSSGFTYTSQILSTNMSGNNIGNRVPMISWGYDSRPRWKFQNGGDIPGYFPYKDVLDHMPSLIDDLKTYMSDDDKDLRVAICGQVGEYAEQGPDLFPSIVVGRSAPSTRMLDIFKSKFNPSYSVQNPTIDLHSLFISTGRTSFSGHCGNNDSINIPISGETTSISSLYCTYIYSGNTIYDGGNNWYAVSSNNSSTSATPYRSIRISSSGEVIDIKYVSC